MPPPPPTLPNDPTPPGSVTLQQVAEQAGVSTATASRVLNGSSRTVNAELSDRVRAVAARLRYVSNGPAQALAKATTSMVGLLVHDVGDPYFSAIAAGAMRVAREQDLLVMVASTVTAVFALNDLMAIGALSALRDAGRRVPEDVSVIGFDDLPLGKDVTPALTTIHLDLEAMGEHAMRLVVTEPDPDDAAARRVVEAQTTLVVRASTASSAR